VILNPEEHLNHQLSDNEMQIGKARLLDAKMVVTLTITAG